MLYTRLKVIYRDLTRRLCFADLANGTESAPRQPGRQRTRTNPDYEEKSSLKAELDYDTRLYSNKMKLNPSGKRRKSEIVSCPGDLFDWEVISGYKEIKGAIHKSHVLSMESRFISPMLRSLLDAV